jgi:hypothetical protein
VSVAAVCCACLLAAWGFFALLYQLPGRRTGRRLGAGVWVLFSVAIVASGHYGVFALAFVVLVIWWLRIKPSNDRDWADDLARMTTGVVTGDRVTLSNVRYFDWRTRTDYTQHWETRAYDLHLLSSVDLVLSYWSLPAIAHVLISFGFDDGQHVVFSVEIRRERTESFSKVGGFFKEFELSILACDERDVIRLRTNVRNEDVYLYRIRMRPDRIRSLFLAYVEQANELARTPRFYNTITVNCTTLVYQMMRRIVGRLPLDIRLLLSGYLPGYVYKVGGLDPQRSLAELRALGRITERARQSDRSPGFSADIRAGVP